MAYRDLTQPNNIDLYCNTINVKTHIGLPDPIDLQGHKIINLSAGTGLTDGINKGYVDGQISAHLFNPANVLAITNTKNSVSTSTGSINTLGGLGVTQDTKVGGTVTAHGLTSIETSNPHLTLYNDSFIPHQTTLHTDAGGKLEVTSDTNQSLYLKDMALEMVNTGDSTTSTVSNDLGYLKLEGSAGWIYTPSGIQVEIDNTTSATSSDGAIVSSGGISCTNAYLNGEITIFKNSTPQINIARSTPSIQTASISLEGHGNVELTCSGDNFNTDKKLICYETTNSTSASDGSITNAGGLGVTGNVYTAGNFRIDNAKIITKEVQLLAGVRSTGAGGATQVAVGNFQYWTFSGSADNSLYGSIDIPHDWKISSDIEVHVHFFNNTNVAGNVDLQLTYDIASPTGTFNTTGTIATLVSVPNSGSANYHFMTSIATISMASVLVDGSIVNWRLTRLGSSDTYGDTSHLCSIGCHYTADRFGSE